MSYQYPQYPGYGVQPPSATSDLLASILARTSPAPTMGFPPTIAPIQPFQLPSFAAPSALPSTSTFLSAPPAPAPISNGVADAQARAVAAFAQRLPSHSRQASVEMEGLFASRPPQRFDPMPAPAPNPVALNSFPIDQFMSAQRAAATPVIEAPSPELSSFEQFLKARIATSRNSDTPFESGSGSGSSTPIGTAVDTKPQTKVTNSRSVFARRPSSSSSSSAMPHKPAPSQPHMHTAVPPSSAAHSVQPPFSAISNQLPSASAPPAHLAYLFGSNSTDALSHIDHDSSSARRARLMAAAAAEHNASSLKRPASASSLSHLNRRIRAAITLQRWWRRELARRRRQYRIWQQQQQQARLLQRQQQRSQVDQRGAYGRMPSQMVAQHAPQPQVPSRQAPPADPYVNVEQDRFAQFEQWQQQQQQQQQQLQHPAQSFQNHQHAQFEEVQQDYQDYPANEEYVDDYAEQQQYQQQQYQQAAAPQQLASPLRHQQQFSPPHISSDLHGDAQRPVAFTFAQAEDESEQYQDQQWDDQYQQSQYNQFDVPSGLTAHAHFSFAAVVRGLLIRQIAQSREASSLRVQIKDVSAMLADERKQYLDSMKASQFDSVELEEGLRSQPFYRSLFAQLAALKARYAELFDVDHRNGVGWTVLRRGKPGFWAGVFRKYRTLQAKRKSLPKPAPPTQAAAPEPMSNVSYGNDDIAVGSQRANQLPSEFPENASESTEDKPKPKRAFLKTGRGQGLLKKVAPATTQDDSANSAAASEPVAAPAIEVKPAPSVRERLKPTDNPPPATPAKKGSAFVIDFGAADAPVSAPVSVVAPRKRMSVAAAPAAAAAAPPVAAPPAPVAQPDVDVSSENKRQFSFLKRSSMSMPGQKVDWSNVKPRTVSHIDSNESAPAAPPLQTQAAPPPAPAPKKTAKVDVKNVKARVDTGKRPSTAPPVSAMSEPEPMQANRQRGLRPPSSAHQALLVSQDGLPMPPPNRFVGHSRARASSGDYDSSDDVLVQSDEYSHPQTPQRGYSRPGVAARRGSAGPQQFQSQQQQQQLQQPQQQSERQASGAVVNTIYYGTPPAVNGNRPLRSLNSSPDGSSSPMQSPEKYERPPLDPVTKERQNEVHALEVQLLNIEQEIARSVGPLLAARPALFVQPIDESSDFSSEEAGVDVVDGKFDVDVVLRQCLRRSRVPRLRRTPPALFALWARDDLSGVLETHIERLKARVRNDTARSQLTFAPVVSEAGPSQLPPIESVPAASAAPESLVAPQSIVAPRTKHRAGGISMDFSAGAFDHDDDALRSDDTLEMFVPREAVVAAQSNMRKAWA